MTMQRYTPDTTCPKCFATPPKRTYHAATETTVEQLVCKCIVCGYGWVMLPGDAPNPSVEFNPIDGETHGLRVSVIESLTEGGWPIEVASRIRKLVKKGLKQGELEAVFIEVIAPAIFQLSEKE